ncbi:MAG TPA: hypothetical protein VHU13_05380 [Solirubrobacteraceae bacterium]|nr:hypothetical protein [Solirubrobacteraceae bacterium]
MIGLRRGGREVYRVYEEDDYLAAAGSSEEDLAEPVAAHGEAARESGDIERAPIVGAARAPRAVIALSLLGVVVVAVGVVVLANSIHVPAGSPASRPTERPSAQSQGRAPRRMSVTASVPAQHHHGLRQGVTSTGSQDGFASKTRPAPAPSTPTLASSGRASLSQLAAASSAGATLPQRAVRSSTWASSQYPAAAPVATGAQVALREFGFER